MHWTIAPTAMEEHHHDDRTAECQLPPSRGTSRPRAAPRLHQLHHVPCQDQEWEGGHADRPPSPGTMGPPTQIPCTTLPAGESTSPARPSNQRLRARPRAPPVGRPTGRSTARRPPVAAAGFTSSPRPAPAVRLPHHSGFNANLTVTRPATHFWGKKPSLRELLAAAAPAAVPSRSDPAPSPEAGKGEAHSGAVERGHHMGQSNGRPPARDPYTDPRKQLDELLKARLSNEEFTRQLAQLRCELLNECEYEAESDGTSQTQPTESGSATPPTATRLAEALTDFICCRWRAAARRALGLGTDPAAERQPDAPPPAALRLAVPLCAAHGGRSADSSLASPPPVADDAAEAEAAARALDAIGARANDTPQGSIPPCSARTGRSPLPSDSLRDSAADSSLASPPAVVDDAASKRKS